MNIPQTESGESTDESIPDWVKQCRMVGRWCYCDSDFVSGIQYLITRNYDNLIQERSS